MPPYYLSMKMPDQKARQQFSLTTTFTPNGRDNLGAFMAVDADAASPDYGTIRLLRLPPDTPSPGPQQVQSKFNSDPTSPTFMRILKGADSDIEYGNLLTVPLDGGLLYVEPVYARGGGLQLPAAEEGAVRMRTPILRTGTTPRSQDTLDEALNEVFGANGEQTTPPPDSGNHDPATVTGKDTVKKAIADAQKAYDDGQAALKKQRLDGVRQGPEGAAGCPAAGCDARRAAASPAPKRKLTARSAGDRDARPIGGGEALIRPRPRVAKHHLAPWYGYSTTARGGAAR